jgi:hypothetical protein
MRAEMKALQVQLDKARKEASRKPVLTAEQKERIAREANARLESRYAAQLRKAEADRIQVERRRERENQQMKKQLELLQRQAEARERMHFGPEGEEELEAVLRKEFPADDIERRGRGGDIIHTVMERGRSYGKIVYECKRTTTWQVAYARQLKRDMETHETRWGLLVSRALPAKQQGMCVVQGVTCCAPHLAHHVARVFREAIVALGRTAQGSGDAGRTVEVLEYLKGEEFQAAMRSLGDNARELRTLLDREKSSHHGWWERRERHYDSIARKSSGIDARIQEILSGTGHVRRRLKVVRA